MEESPEDVVLVRVYGNKTELIVDRDNELKSFQVEIRALYKCGLLFSTNQGHLCVFVCYVKVLHANGCAPRLYCTFLNGICYEFMQGDALGTQDVRDPALLRCEHVGGACEPGANVDEKYSPVLTFYKYLLKNKQKTQFYFA